MSLFSSLGAGRGILCSRRGKWVLVCCVWLLSTPVLHGQGLAEWVRQLESDDPFQKVDAIIELGKLGDEAEPAVPALIRLFPDGRVGIRNSDGFPAPPESVSVSGRASAAVAAVGTPAVPWLVKALGSENTAVRIMTAKTLGRIGPSAAEALPALVRRCEDPEPEVRREAVTAIGRIHARMEIALPKLRQAATSDTEKWVRYAAVDVLATLAGPGDDDVETLVSALTDSSPDVRGAAARALGRYGSRSESAIPKLIESLADTDKRWDAYTPDFIGQKPVYADVVESLTLLATACPDRVPLVADTVETHASGQVRAGAALVLIRIGRNKPESLRALMRVLEERQGGVEKALQAVAELRADGREAEGLVLACLHDGDEGIRFQAIKTLGAVAGEEGIAALIETVGDEDVVVGSCAAEALGDLGPSAAKAVPALLETLSRPETPRSFLLCESAVEALGKIGPGAKPALPKLLEILKDGEREDELRELAVTAVSQIAPQNPEVLPVLLGILDAVPAWSKMNDAVVPALGKVGPAAGSAVPRLIKILGDEDAGDDVRASAVRSLLQVGAPSREVIAVISQTLREEPGVLNEDLRLESVHALGTLRARSALPVLEKVASDEGESDSVQKAAAEAVRRIRLPE